MPTSSGRIGAWLRSPSRRRGDRSRAARHLGLSERTLARWQGQAGPKKVGRPAHSQEEIEQAKPRVLEVLHKLGYRAGWTTVKKLLIDVPKRVINALLKRLKADHRAREAQRFKQQRVHIRVLAQGAVLAQDSTHVGGFKGRKVWAEVAKDAATCEAWAFGDGKPINGQAMLEHLKILKAQDRLPLVLATDNGSAYKEQSVRAWLAENQVVQLFSRPRTPQDNGRAERGIGEGKALAGLGKGVLLQSRGLGAKILDQALQRLNQHWPRTTKGGLTAAQLKQTLPHWKANISRSSFYQAACSAIRAIKADTKRALRRETREAIFRTLERFGLILRTRGELNRRYAKQDRIS
jgi:transposase InsO family protein